MEDYGAFHEELQSLLTARFLTAEEMKKYVQFIESSNMDKNAFIIIVQYCTTLKGPKVSAEYILAVAKNLVCNGNLTTEQVQKALFEKSNGENEHKKEASSQEEYLIKLFRKLNPRLKKNVIDIVKGLTTSSDNK